MYGPEAVEGLRFIRGAQLLGLRLREIRELLDIRRRGLCPCGHTEALVQSRLAELDQELSGLRVLRRELSSFLDRFPAQECGDEEGWPCESEFIRKGKEVNRA